MSRFFVGQRVRVVRVEDTDPPILGHEAVVTSINYCGGDPDPLYGLDIAPFWEDQIYWYGFASGDLEPILPSGHRPCEDQFKRDLDKMLEGLAA